MEAAPRLPMVSFELKTSNEAVSFGPKLKQYIAGFYHEDPESYNNEIHNLESLRSSAVRPAIDVAGCQNLKKYYCQLNFLKSRFPMEKGQTCAVSFSWKDLYAGLVCSVPDIDFELSSILYNIGALHSQLGATDSRSSSEGMKISCTHFQCAAWAFQHLKENFSQLVSLSLSPEVIHFMHQLCLAQAQECILEKSMMDNRKSTIIAKVAVQVVDYYNQAISILNAGTDDGTMHEIVGTRVYKDWNRYIKFKVAYHSCVSLLYQGQQAEEAQKMGERVAYYQAASEQLEEARKIAKGNMGHQQHEVDEALGFTQDVVEGKKKAAKNENEFIYHEVVPEKDALQQVNGASLVKGIPFSVNDPDVSGSDLFQRLVPMEAHEASSVYSEQKAEMLRRIGSIVDSKDSELAEFMSSLQLDCLGQYRQAVGIPQEIVDRAAAICAKPQATQALVEVMGKLAGTCNEVESLLSEIQEMIKEEETKEQEYQKIMGSRPPSIVSTDLTREAGKYSEAHSKANESNQTLHRAMTMHMSNLKVLAQPLSELKKTIPSVVTNDPNIDESLVNELEQLVAKVDEMRNQRATLLTQLREAVCNDDITALLVTKPANLTMEQLFQKELGKHKHQAALIEQNLAAQENILQALTEVYAKFASTRRHMLDVLKRREQTVSALIASYDAYDDLLSKANKGIEFYQKLEGNITKLQQRVKSACRVNEEEREQMLAKSGASIPSVSAKTTPATTLPSTTAPKLKDYLASMKAANVALPKSDAVNQWVPPSIRPAPLGSEETSDKPLRYDTNTNVMQYPTPVQPGAMQYPYQPNVIGPNDYYPTQNPSYQYQDPNMYYQYNATNLTVSNSNTNMAQSQQPATQTYTTPTKLTSQDPTVAQTPSQTQMGYQYDPKLYSQGQNYQQPTSTITTPTKLPAQDQTVVSAQVGYQYDPKMYNQAQAYQQPTSTYNYQPDNKNVQQPNQTNYYTDTNQPANMQQPYPSVVSTPDTKLQFQPSYHHPSYQNYQSPIPNVYYPTVESYTPASTPQQNYVTPAAYSPCVDTRAPSQKLQQNYNHPPGYLSSSDYYSMANNFTNSPPTVASSNQPGYGNAAIAVSYQSETGSLPATGYTTGAESNPVDYTTGTSGYSTDPNTQTNLTNPVSYPIDIPPAAPSAYSSGYTYPGANVAAGYANQYSQQQNQAPNEEYQRQYQYIPQYYPSTSYEQYPQTNDPNVQYTNGATDQKTNSVNSNYYYSPYGHQTIGNNSMTVIQASNNNNNPPTPSGKNSSLPTNMDLLTGLDFTVNQAPLQPQIPVKTTVEDTKPSNTNISVTPVKITSSTNVVNTSSDSNIKTTKVAEPTEVKTEESTKPVTVEDPLSDPDILANFTTEVEKLEKFVDGLTVKTLNGPTPLDIKWKEIQDQQDRDAQKSSISVARCYPMKNRFPDIMPYDQFRVELPSTKDDYINASHVKNINKNCPNFIVTQAPLKSTIDDFWTMIWEQQIQVVICMLGESEIQTDASVYWPMERGSDLQVGKFRIGLQGVNSREYWIERIISISDGVKNLVTVHMQFISWPGGGLFPPTVFPLLSLASATLACHRQQRVKNRPLLIHCLSGVGRSGVLCLLIAAMSDPTSMLDVAAVGNSISRCRKNILRDREHLKFAYQAVLQHFRDLLSGKQLQSKMQNINITADDNSSRRSSVSSEQSTEQIKQRKKFTPEQFGALKEQGISSTIDTADPLSALDPLWTMKK